MSSKILVIGAGGKIGTELVLSLCKLKGDQNVIASDLKDECPKTLKKGPCVKLDVLDREMIRCLTVSINKSVWNQTVTL